MANKQQVIDLHRKYPGLSAKEIAERLNCNSGYVRATAQREGLVLGRHKNAKRFGPDPASRKIDRDEAAYLRAQGNAYSAIAAHFDVHPDAVRTALAARQQMLAEANQR